MFLYGLSGCASVAVAVAETSDYAPVLSKAILKTEVARECSFTLKRVRDMIRTHIKILFDKSDIF